MAAGRPIVATDVCDAGRWLADGAGLVVTPGSPDALAAAISYVLENPDRAEAMGARARLRLVQLASEDRLSARMCGVVEAAIDGRSVTPAPAFRGSFSAGTGHPADPATAAFAG